MMFYDLCFVHVVVVVFVVVVFVVAMVIVVGLTVHIDHCIGDEMS